jgi:ABC transport system ATP-binding/permease protein
LSRGDDPPQTPLANGGVRSPRAPAGPLSGSAAAARQAGKELARLERQIERLSGREVALGEEMATHATDYEKLTALGAELRSIQDEKTALEERWLEVAASLEG